MRETTLSAEAKQEIHSWTNRADRYQEAADLDYHQLLRASTLPDAHAIAVDLPRSDALRLHATASDRPIKQRLENLLSAWCVFNPEVGYVQSMNVVAALLLQLLDGDEPRAFWCFAALISQLPPRFYSRAPTALLGFWVEAELLVLLARDWLGLRNLRVALLQIAPKWLLEYFVGTLPLPTLVNAWGSALAAATDDVARPPTLHLRLALALLQLRRQQLLDLDTDDPAQQHAAFELLQATQPSEVQGRWVLDKALAIPLDATSVDEMRRRLRHALSVGAAASRQPALPPAIPPEVAPLAAPMLKGRSGWPERRSRRRAPVDLCARLSDLLVLW